MSGGACHLTIGPVRFRLEADMGVRIRYDRWAYRSFAGAEDPAPGSPPLVELPVQVVPGAAAMPPGEPVFQSGTHWAVWPEENGWCICWGFSRRERPRIACHVTRELDRAVLQVEGDLGDAPLRFPLDQILSWGLLAKCGGVLMHASAMIRDGLAWVFAGRSGAGKSTLAALCRDAGWQSLNDDRVMVFARDGILRVAGTPWHGSGLVAEAAEAPLGGIYLLEQSGRDGVNPIDAASARLPLLDVVSIPWFDDDWAQTALDALEGIVQAAPLARFQFTRSPEAVLALADEAVVA